MGWGTPKSFERRSKLTFGGMLTREVLELLACGSDGGGLRRDIFGGTPLRGRRYRRASSEEA